MQIYDIIKYEGDNRTFVWKYPGEDFNTKSKLIVHESQEAVFFKNGMALDLYAPGEHILETKNIPLLNRLINLPSNGVSPFHCEVYFVNKTEQMAIPWGVGRVNYKDPTVNDAIFVIGASGELTLRISDSRKLLTKLVGTENVLNQETLMHYFKAPIMTHAKAMLPKILREKEVSIFDVEEYLPELSVVLQERISKEMEDYGVYLEKLWIHTINKPENDPVYKTLLRQRAERVTLVNQGEIDMQKANYNTQVELIRHSAVTGKEKMNIDVKKYEQDTLGYTWQQQEEYDVMKRLADNEGTGSDARNALMGIGMGFGVGGTIGQAFNNIAASTMGTGMINTPVGTSNNMPSNTDMSHSEMTIPGMVNLKQEQKEDSVKEDVSENSNPDKDIFKKKVDDLLYAKKSGLLTEEEFLAEKEKLLNSFRG